MNQKMYLLFPNSFFFIKYSVISYYLLLFQFQIEDQVEFSTPAVPSNSDVGKEPPPSRESMIQVNFSFSLLLKLKEGAKVMS